jgi:hypothetical protein
VLTRSASSRPDPLLVRDLEWFLGLGITKCCRSTEGSVLERLLNSAFDSENNRIPAMGDTWLLMMPKKVKNEPFYEMEFRDLYRIGRVSRILNRVAEAAPISARVLGAFYGDAGARWGRETHGRDASIWHLTATGQRLIETIRRRFPTSLDIRDDEVVVQDLLDQARSPNDLRERHHRKMRGEADILKVEAHRALAEADRACNEARRGLSGYQ